MTGFVVAFVVGVLVVGGVVSALVGSFLVSRYNSLVQVQENVDQAWANIEVSLKQRAEELPKLIDTATHFLGQEREILNEVTQARAAVQEAEGPRAEAEADQQLRGALGSLFAVAEDYPELRSSEQFQQLQKRISALEGQIADRRELYNESATIYNARIRQIPDLLFALVLEMEPRELFEAEEGELENVDMGAQLDAAQSGPEASGERSET
jgi:LemA protein